MKNKRKGFIIPLLIAIIAVLAIGGGVYVYKNKKTEESIVAGVIGPPEPKIGESSYQKDFLQRMQKEKKDTNKKVVVPSLVWDTKWKDYKNDEIGIYFKYPGYFSDFPKLSTYSYKKKWLESDPGSSNIRSVVSNIPALMSSSIMKVVVEGKDISNTDELDISIVPIGDYVYYAMYSSFRYYYNDKNNTWIGVDPFGKKIDLNTDSAEFKNESVSGRLFRWGDAGLYQLEYAIPDIKNGKMIVISYLGNDWESFGSNWESLKVVGVGDIMKTFRLIDNQ